MKLYQQQRAKNETMTLPPCCRGPKGGNPNRASLISLLLILILNYSIKMPPTIKARLSTPFHKICLVIRSLLVQSPSVFLAKMTGIVGELVKESKLIEAPGLAMWP